MTGRLKAVISDHMWESIFSPCFLGGKQRHFCVCRQHKDCHCHSLDQLCSLALRFEDDDDDEDEVLDFDGVDGITFPGLCPRKK